MRSEIARQQKDKESEFLHGTNRGSGFPSGSPASSSLSSTPSIEKIMSESAAGYASSSRSAAMQSHTSALEEEVARWRGAYEEAVRENEQMRSSRGAMMMSAGSGGVGDKRMLDAAEWRDRFEACVAEKLALMERLDALSSGGGRVGTGQSRKGLPGGVEANGISEGSKPVEKAYLELRAEYKVKNSNNPQLINHPFECLLRWQL